MKKLILKCKLSPGDVLTLTAAIKALHETYPHEYQTDVRTPCPDIFEHNPWITPIPDDEGQLIECNYPIINQSSQIPHCFLRGYTQHLGQVLGVPLELTTNKPDVYLTDEEKTWMSQVEEIAKQPIPFWIMNAGVKSCFTAKQWPIESYQTVVDHFRGVIQFVQVGLLEHLHNHHIDGCIDFRGRTSLRQMIRLAWHMKAAIGPVTFLQHLSAAFDKPYFCLAGGRENPQWIGSYSRQQTFHTIGQLPCCLAGGCWRSRVIALEDGKDQDNHLCELPVLGLSAPVAKCMSAITSGEVIASIQRFINLSSLH